MPFACGGAHALSVVFFVLAMILRIAGDRSGSRKSDKDGERIAKPIMP